MNIKEKGGETLTICKRATTLFFKNPFHPLFIKGYTHSHTIQMDQTKSTTCPSLFSYFLIVQTEFL